jgi:hypothetical protein
MTDLNERIHRAITLSTQVVMTKAAWEKAVTEYLATEKAFRELWDTLTLEERQAVNDAC